MTDELRRAVAYIAARLVNGADASAVYDYAAGGYFQFGGDVSASRVNVYDYSRGCYLDGTPPSLYDYGRSTYFDFKVNGLKVEGYDYGTSTFYEATVDGNNVAVYDYGRSGYFNYSV